MRWSERILIAWYLYASVLAAALPLPAQIRARSLLVNLVVVAACMLLRLAHSVVRDWFPLAMMLLAYREMGWFAPARHDYRLEHIWIVWDRILLADLHAGAAIEWLGPGLPALLEVSYSLVYAIGPFCLAMLYVYRRRDLVDRFLVILLLSVLLVYAQFPWWPSEPPRVVFPLDPAPAFVSIFRRFNLGLLQGYGIHTSVFPSAHVSAAFAGAFGMMTLLPEHRWVGRVVLILAILIATATVYGRYHYAADAVAGLMTSLIVFAFIRVYSRPENRTHIILV